MLQRRRNVVRGAGRDRRNRYETAAGITNRSRAVVVAMLGRLYFLLEMVRLMKGMSDVLGHVMSGRLMMGLRRLFLRKGHDRAMRQAHEAEQRGNDDPKSWAEGPERSHAPPSRLPPAPPPIKFWQSGVNLDPVPGER